MARYGAILLALLLALCFLTTTFARTLDIPGNAYREFSSALSAQKQGSISSSAERGHLRRVSVSPILYHEKTEHEENTNTQETGHAENMDKIISSSSASLPGKEGISSPFRSRTGDLPFSQDEQILSPILSHSEDIVLHKSGLFLHDDSTIASYLAQNGLPIGLLPSSVASYSITDHGDFIICLQEACYAEFDYEVYYSHTLTGKLSYGTISDVSGIKAKEGLFWVSVTGVHTDAASSEYIYFNAGPISKKLSISQFQTIPVCKVKALASSAWV